MNENIIFSEHLCGICGEAHSYSECPVLLVTKKVPDKILPSKARLSLPDVCTIERMADGSYTVIANTLIQKGTQFGPLEAQKLLTLDPTIIFPLKLFNNNVEDLSEYYLNTTDEFNCNWIMFIPPAQSLEEQNLICFQEKSKIIYMSLKDINAGECLKVWYSPHYAKQMRKQLLTNQIFEDTYVNTIVPEPIDLNKLLKKQQKINDRENWTCKFCGKLEKDITLFASHIIEHYNKKLTKDCDVCNKSFSTLKNLRKHIKLQHTKPIITNTINSTSSNTSTVNEKSKDARVGGPLLNDLLADSLDNTNLVLPNIELNMNSLENDALNLAVDNFLTDNVKELDHFNFEISESQEQYVCDICLKVFTKQHYLLQHLKKHTGRFTCGFCLKIFCRKENLNLHKCINGEVVNSHKCEQCDKSFMMRKHLMRHIYVVHERRYACEKCKKQYHTKKDYNDHYCLGSSCDQTALFPCTLCNKKFFRDSYLRKHLNRHNKKNQQVSSLNLICEICGVCCKSRSGMYLHMKNHSGRSLECHVCNKTFHRKYLLDQHLLSHHDSAVKCGECNKLCKNEKTLSVHMRMHKQTKSFKCDNCPKTFTQASNLNAHVNRFHMKKCKLCNKRFSSLNLLEAHQKMHTMKEFFSCPICSKCVKLKSSLKRHIKKNHPEQNSSELISNAEVVSANLDLDSLDCLDVDKMHSENVTLEQICDAEAPISDLPNSLSENDSNNFDSIVDNFENIINSYRSEELLMSTETPKIDKNEKRFLDFTELQMDMDNTTFDITQPIGSNHREVCLSMPDLAENDQEIMLGDNAYMLDNGTIVEPKDQGNVLVYVLDKNF
ncbi:hypothetical protein FQR65_LT06685 [Abscondita terminalis]|nr:hypothetical protein FQR65_LT06685 [Abscondita terminalis]